ncbi:MAG: hypothetical protein KUG75_04185 [Pseudomonadales bacterium]|nr:hypothetical protein [Pseudomonadales bacterium]
MTDRPTDSTFEALVQTLKKDRDELRLQIHLASLETQSEWHKLEAKFNSIEPKLASFVKDAKTSAHDVGEATQRAAKELGKAYQRLKKKFD